MTLLNKHPLKIRGRIMFYMPRPISSHPQQATSSASAASWLTTAIPCP